MISLNLVNINYVELCNNGYNNPKRIIGAIDTYTQNDVGNKGLFILDCTNKIYIYIHI